jgi:hypothetical protein
MINMAVAERAMSLEAATQATLAGAQIQSTWAGNDLDRAFAIGEGYRKVRTSLGWKAGKLFDRLMIATS